MSISPRTIPQPVLWPLVALLLGSLACAPRSGGSRPSIAPLPDAVAAGVVTPGAERDPAAETPARTVPDEPSAALMAGEREHEPALAPTAPPTPTPPPLVHIDALALGGATPVRSLPSMLEGETVATLPDRAPILIEQEVRGQRWVVGDQTWAMAVQDWSNLWYRIDGGFVYAGFVFIPRAGELDSLAATDGERWIDVNLLTQSARAMEGNRAVHSSAVTTGKPGFETSAGHYTIPAWGRTFNETMTSSQAGIQDPNERYDVHNVLYTQYFDGSGDALHLNYWQPEFVFGRQRTSHGCVGLELHDAQYLWLFARPGMRVEIGPPAPPAARTPAATAVPAPARATTTPAAPAPAPAGATAQAVPSPAPAGAAATPTP